MTLLVKSWPSKRFALREDSSSFYRSSSTSVSFSLRYCSLSDRDYSKLCSCFWSSFSWDLFSSKSCVRTSILYCFSSLVFFFFSFKLTILSSFFLISSVNWEIYYSLPSTDSYNSFNYSFTSDCSSFSCCNF